MKDAQEENEDDKQDAKDKKKQVKIQEKQLHAMWKNMSQFEYEFDIRQLNSVDLSDQHELTDQVTNGNGIHQSPAKSKKIQKAK